MVLSVSQKRKIKSSQPPKHKVDLAALLRKSEMKETDLNSAPWEFFAFLKGLGSASRSAWSSPRIIIVGQFLRCRSWAKHTWAGDS